MTSSTCWSSVHEAKDQGSDLDMIMPFHVKTAEGWQQDPNRVIFRSLAHAIFSQPRAEFDSFEKFNEQRRATLENLVTPGSFPGAT